MKFLNPPHSLPKDGKPFLFYFENDPVPEVLKESETVKGHYVSELTNGNSKLHTWDENSCAGWLPLPEYELPHFRVFGNDLCTIFKINGYYDVILMVANTIQGQLLYKLNSRITDKQKALAFMHSLNSNVIHNAKQLRKNFNY